MATTYTANLNAPKVTESQGGKESDISDTFDIFDSTIAGKYRLNVSAASSPHTLSEADSHYSRFEFHGARASALTAIINPMGVRRFSVKNENTTQTITVKVTSGGVGAPVPSGSTYMLEHDGTNVFDSIDEADARLDTAAWTIYSPTVTAGAGSFTSAFAVGYYKQFGKTVFVRVVITITTNGTAAASVRIDLPVTSRNAGAQILVGINSLTGLMIRGYIFANSTTVSIQNYDTTYPGANATELIVEGVYEAA